MFKFGVSTRVWRFYQFKMILRGISPSHSSLFLSLQALIVLLRYSILAPNFLWTRILHSRLSTWVKIYTTLTYSLRVTSFIHHIEINCGQRSCEVRFSLSVSTNSENRLKFLPTPNIDPRSVHTVSWLSGVGWTAGGWDVSFPIPPSDASVPQL